MQSGEYFVGAGSQIPRLAHIPQVTNQMLVWPAFDLPKTAQTSGPSWSIDPIFHAYFWSNQHLELETSELGWLWPAFRLFRLWSMLARFHCSRGGSRREQGATVPRRGKYNNLSGERIGGIYKRKCTLKLTRWKFLTKEFSFVKHFHLFNFLVYYPITQSEIIS